MEENLGVQLLANDFYHFMVAYTSQDPDVGQLGKKRLSRPLVLHLMWRLF